MVAAGVAFVVGQDATLRCRPSEAATARVYSPRGKRKSRLEGVDNGDRSLEDLGVIDSNRRAVRTTR
jgi:hypothetical protein